MLSKQSLKRVRVLITRVQIHTCNTHPDPQTHPQLQSRREQSLQRCSLCAVPLRAFPRGRAASGEPRDTFPPWLTLRTELRPDGVFLFGVFFACDNAPTAEAFIIELRHCRGRWGAAVQRSAVSLFMTVTKGSSAVWDWSAFSVWLTIFPVLLFRALKSKTRSDGNL